MKTCTVPNCARTDTHTERHMAYFHAGTDELCGHGIIRGFEMEPYCSGGRNIDYLPLDDAMRHAEQAAHRQEVAR